MSKFLGFLYDFLFIVILFPESSPKGKRKLAFPSKKPALLCGKRFYLDLIGEGKTKITRNAINNLGGVSVF